MLKKNWLVEHQITSEGKVFIVVLNIIFSCEKPAAIEGETQ